MQEVKHCSNISQLMVVQHCRSHERFMKRVYRDEAAGMGTGRGV